MPLQTFHGQTLTAAVKDASGNEIPIGVLKGATVRAEFDRQTLYGQGSILRQAVSRINHRVTVSAKYAKFSGKLLGAILGTQTPDTDIEGNAALGRTQAQTRDATQPPLFSVTGTLTATDGTSTFLGKVSNVDFMFTLNWPEGDWVTNDLEGEGDRLFLEYAS